jgi:hypothetical protein
VDGASAADRRRLVTSTGDIDTSRELSADGATITVESTAHYLHSCKPQLQTHQRARAVTVQQTSKKSALAELRRLRLLR